MRHDYSSLTAYFTYIRKLYAVHNAGLINTATDQTLTVHAYDVALPLYMYIP